jgi:hypothetical protein
MSRFTSGPPYGLRGARHFQTLIAQSVEMNRVNWYLPSQEHAPTDSGLRSRGIFCVVLSARSQGSSGRELVEINFSETLTSYFGTTMNELWGGAVTSADGSITMAHTKPAAQDSYVITSQAVADDLDAWTRVTWEAVADDAWTTNPTYKAILLSEAAGHHGAPHNVIYRAFEWLAPGAKF